MQQNIFIETPRLILRDWLEGDIIPFISMNADPQVMEYFLSTLTPDESKNMVERIRRKINECGYGLFAVEEKDSGEFIGFTGFQKVGFDADFTPAVEIGWRLRRESWGKGYATEAAKACLEYAVDLPFDEVYSFTTLSNKRSERVMQKIGMSRVGEFEHPNVPESHPFKRHILYKKNMIQRPELNDNISLPDFRSFYWLKEELADFCKTKGITSSGGKLDLAKRIEQYLQNGTIITTAKKVTPTSKFDWKKAELSLDTVITDSYRNSENVRAFMASQIGTHFRFNLVFCNWMKANEGKTMRDAVEEWKRIRLQKKENPKSTTIDKQFEYNTYIRDFMGDNPDKSFKDAVRYWNMKKKTKDSKKYKREDLSE